MTDEIVLALEQLTFREIHLEIGWINLSDAGPWEAEEETHFLWVNGIHGNKLQVLK